MEMDVENETVRCAVWGLNDSGQLGSSEKQIIESPELLECNKGIFGLASGDFHTVVITEALTLMGCGQNLFGQVGTNAKGNHTSALEELKVGDIYTL